MLSVCRRPDKKLDEYFVVIEWPLKKSRIQMEDENANAVEGARTTKKTKASHYSTLELLLAVKVRLHNRSIV